VLVKVERMMDAAARALARPSTPVPVGAASPPQRESTLAASDRRQAQVRGN